MAMKHRVAVNLPPELRARIADWRRRQPTIPTESGAIRLLVEAALEAEGVAPVEPPAAPAGSPGKPRRGPVKAQSLLGR